ncbi:MAG: glycosyltransferase [Anabaena sp. CRKS33]|jgi:glycosyltransferase involved in cell wall biosynthesis|nr:MAG: glycosyltransferase [Anabaena sp. CRKS33]
MRILHITNHLQKIGNGIVNVAVDLACLQAQSGFDVAVASAGGEYETLLADYGVKHFHLNQCRTPLNLIKATWNYRRIIKDFQPDIVHVHMMTGVILAGIFRKNREYHLVSTIHNEFQPSAVLMGLADQVIAVSNAVANSMMKRGIPSEKLRVVSNGTLGSPRHKKLQDYQPVAMQYPSITTVAGMYNRKGISELIEAFKIIAEDFPEAREAGCAIIASNVDGIPETLDHSQAGILIPPKDIGTLANTLTQLLSDRQLLNKWKFRAQQNLARFHAARVNEETLAVYRELMRKSNVIKVMEIRKLVTGK